MTATYLDAVKYFEKRDYKTTQEILTNLDGIDKNNPEALYLLAVVKSITGDYKGAVPLFKNVVTLKPFHTEAFFNLALCLQNQNKDEEALTYYKKAVELNPFLSEAYNNIAVIYQKLEKYEEAEEALRKSIKTGSNNTNAVSSLSELTLDKESSSAYREAYALYRKGDLKGTRDILIKILEKSPDSVQLLTALGIVYFEMKEYGKAAGFYEKILSMEGNNADAYYSLGVCRQYMEYDEAALKNYKKAIEYKPDHLGALNNLGLMYSALKNYKDAEKYYKKAIEYDPNYFHVLLNLGGLRLTSDDFDEAQYYFERALTVLLRENKEIEFITKAYTNIGVVNFRRKNVDEAFKYFDKAIELSPENFLAHYNKAEALLVSGRLEEGWKEYEWRLDRRDFGKRKFKKFFDRNIDLRGKKILVFAEQGVGDAIQFVRYLPLLKKKGCHIIFECSKEVHPLFRGLEGVDEVIERNATERPRIEYDYEIPLLSLPLYFETNLNNIPGNVPYIRADKELTKKWSYVINEENKTKIGIVWAGSPGHANDRHRSVKLQMFLPLLSTEGTRFYSLQKGFGELQSKDFQLLLTDLGKEIETFSDTAAIIENLDLIITVDTSVAHLAGAMGKETWLLLPFVPDWRWLFEGNGSAWYPTIKLYRQPAIFDWQSVFTKLTKDLADVSGKKSEHKIKNGTVQTKINVGSLYLGLTSGENFGWGVCSKYLKKELSEKINVVNMDEHGELVEKGNVDGPMIHVLNNNDFNGLYPVRGTKNIGYTFFEYELNDVAVRNAVNYDLILGGSSWNEKKLRDRGIKNAGMLIQGVDPDLFYFEERETRKNLFVIFSGGKFELRKGQDLVLRAVKILQQKFNDIIMINAWYNMWPQTMNSMATSKHIKYEFKGETWKNFMVNLCRINGIDGDKILTLPITPNNKLRDLYLSSDIGLFPNRCEGGTNLVLMEYMACGKPVIASYNSGHKDILTPENSLPLVHMNEFKLYDDNKTLIADWEEPDIDEIIAKIEYAYYHREEIKQIGKNAAAYMKKFTWKDSAESLLKYIQ